VDGEFYEKEGKLYGRPSHILDYFAPPELVDWKARTGLTEAKRISRIALKHGSRIDELIRESKAPKKSDSIEVVNCFRAWSKWLSDYSPKFIVFPPTGYCEKRMVAGTPDIYWEDQQDLIDVKSSKSVHENYFFQLGFYASVSTSPIKRLAVLRLDKELGEYEYVTNEKVGMTVQDCIDGFNGLLAYYGRYKRVQSALKPKEKVYDGSN
jgi:hypothetical protein